MTNPPIIPNLGWRSGMGNLDSNPTDGDCFWVQDYGMDEANRWIVKPQAGGLFQSTANINGNCGSRAYPARLAKDGSNWKGLSGVGAGFEGLWLIGITIGSNGAGDNAFCETFYLAERNSLDWGPDHYGDGSGVAKYNSREIDIMETKWHNGGVNLNLPGAGGTSWNPQPDYGVINRITPNQWPMWSDVGGAPTKYPILFGCLIWNDKLWLFAYPANPNQNPWKQWYCTKAIPKNNATYVQKYPFVPYIGTWCEQGNTQSGGFETGYNEFTFWDKDYISKVVKISRDGINPYDNPDEFLSLLF